TLGSSDDVKASFAEPLDPEAPVVCAPGRPRDISCLRDDPHLRLSHAHASLVDEPALQRARGAEHQGDGLGRAQLTTNHATVFRTLCPNGEGVPTEALESEATFRIGPCRGG